MQSVKDFKKKYSIKLQFFLCFFPFNAYTVATFLFFLGFLHKKKGVPIRHALFKNLLICFLQVFFV